MRLSAFLALRLLVQSRNITGAMSCSSCDASLSVSAPLCSLRRSYNRYANCGALDRSTAQQFSFRRTNSERHASGLAQTRLTGQSLCRASGHSSFWSVFCSRPFTGAIDSSAHGTAAPVIPVLTRVRFVPTCCNSRAIPSYADVLLSSHWCQITYPTTLRRRAAAARS